MVFSPENNTSHDNVVYEAYVLNNRYVRLIHMMTGDMHLEIQTLKHIEVVVLKPMPDKERLAFMTYARDLLKAGGVTASIVQKLKTEFPSVFIAS